MVHTLKAALPNLKGLPYGGAQAVRDPDVLLFIDSVSADFDLQAILDDTTVVDGFLERYRVWVTESRHNSLTLDEFPVACYSQGTTEAFDKFYLRNHDRRLRCFRGEYMYHMASWRNYFPNWCWLEDDEVDHRDAVMISLPFADTGNEHSAMRDILDRCELLGVPVLIDCAYFGICREIRFAFEYQCITDITFSLSKSFPVAHARIGMRLTREDDDDSMLVNQKTNYTNRLGAALGMTLLHQFSPDHNINRWHSTQLEFCRQLGLMPSQTVLFGIDHGARAEYNRGGVTNRLCLARYLPSGTLPETA